MEALPLTTNGKLDTRALPAPEYTTGEHRAPASAVEEILAGIYAQVLGLERVGIDDSFFDLGGDSILSMQVVARARAAGCELSAAGHFRRADRGPAGPGHQSCRRPCRPDRRRHRRRGVHADHALAARRGKTGGPVDEFNQTVVLQAPAGVTQTDVVAVLQALLDRHAMLRLRADDGADDWSLEVPEPGSVDAGGCLQSVDVLSDEALVAARSRLDPAAGVMLSALWVAATGQLAVLVHHLAVDAVSWRILLEDLNIAWAQHRNGQPVALPAAGRRSPGGRHC